VTRAVGRWAVVVAVAVAGACSLGRHPDADALAALRARDLMVPVAGVAPADVPDSYDEVRDGGVRQHHALDIPAPRGTPVVAADDGVVLALRQSPHGGLTVYTTDPDRRFVYYYAHLSGYRRGLRRGAEIARGDVLGYVGTTGNADHDWPHLHFQVMVYPADGHWWRGAPLDPRSALVRPGHVHSS